MQRTNGFIDSLTRNHARLSNGLLASICIALLLVGISAWAVSRLLAGQYESVRFHFSAVGAAIAEQERFLDALHLSRALTDTDDHIGRNLYKQRRLAGQQTDIYLAQENAYSLAFVVQLKTRTLADEDSPWIFSQGAKVASVYSTFWSSGRQIAPMLMLFNVSDSYDIYMPSDERGEAANVMNLAETTLSRLRKTNDGGVADTVLWESLDDGPETGKANQLLAFINVSLPRKGFGELDPSGWVVASTVLNLSDVINTDRSKGWTFYDDLTLISPEGRKLAGHTSDWQEMHQGFNWRTDAIYFKVGSEHTAGWQAVYRVGYRAIFYHDIWPLLVLLVVVLLCIPLSFVLSNMYRRRVVGPAKAAHDQLAESEAFNRAIVEFTPAGLCVVRKSDFEVLFESEQARQWHSSSDLVALLGAPDAQDWQAGEVDLAAGARHLHVRYASARYRGENVLLCALSDVTQHIEYASSSNEARQMADQANYAKTQFLATMSHEIRTPLYGVLGTIELLDRTQLDEKQRKYLDTIQRSSETLFQLISDVLDVTKIESQQMSIKNVSFSPLELAEDCIRTYAAAAKLKGLLLYHCVDVAVADYVLGDRHRIAQVINNLLSNAIKFTESGKVTLHVLVRSSTHDTIEIEWQVADSGVGISQAHQAFLFEPFFQVPAVSSAPEGGAGLGLAICRKLSDLMGGELSVISEAGLGSRFSLRMKLPVVSETLFGVADIEPKTERSYVSAPTAELAQNVCDWLNRFGVKAELLMPRHALTQSDALLIDVMPALPLPAWPGPRLIAVADPKDFMASAQAATMVDAWDLRAIAQAASAPHPRFKPADGVGSKADIGGVTGTANEEGLGLRILVAEDNKLNRAIIVEQLEALGCQVVGVADGEKAFLAWKKADFDLVLTDLSMPQMNGYELTAEIRQRGGKLPIVGITANAMMHEEVRCAQAGMDAWLTKPLRLKMLRDCLLKHCMRDISGVGEGRAFQERVGDFNIVIPEHLRALFVEAITEDIGVARSLIERADAVELAARLHSMAGALGAAGLEAEAESLSEIEVALLQERESFFPKGRKRLLQYLEAVSDLVDRVNGASRLGQRL